MKIKQLVVASLMAATFTWPAARALELGTNLSAPSDYTPAMPFNDLMKVARDWQTQLLENPGQAYDTNQIDRVTLNGNGWPSSPIPFIGSDGLSHYLHTTWTQQAYPIGKYYVVFDGKGSVRFQSGSASQTYTGTSATGTTVGTLDRVNQNGSMRLSILSSEPDPNGVGGIRNIRIVHESNYKASSPARVTQTFNQTYVDTLKFYEGPIRFMDWGETNYSPLVGARVLKSYYSQGTDRGAAVEYMVELANLLQRDMWYCVPHRANNTYITNVANIIATNLDPGLKVWVEYSNETWNSKFSRQAPNWADGQYSYLRQLATDNNTTWTAIHAQKSADVWTGFQAAFTAASADPSRVVRVLSAQAVQPSQIIDENTALAAYNQKADVFSPAAYFAGTISPSEEDFDNAQWTGGDSSDAAIWSSAGWTRAATGVSLVLVNAPRDRVAQLQGNGAYIQRVIATDSASKDSAAAGIVWRGKNFAQGDIAYFKIDRTGNNDWTTVATITAATANDSRIQVLMTDVANFVRSANTKVRVEIVGAATTTATVTVEYVRFYVYPTEKWLLETKIPAEIAERAGFIQAWVDYASEQGAIVYSYEGGQHMLAGTLLQNKTELTDALENIQRSTAMKSLYTQWLTTMHSIGLQGIVHFTDISGYSKYGYWGAYEYLGQSSDLAPKLKALQEWKTTAQPATFTEQALGSYWDNNNTNQDVSQNVYSLLANNVGISMGAGNLWKSLAYGYRTTLKTRLTFEYQPGVTGELHGVGLDNDRKQPELAFYKVAGTETYGTAVSKQSTLNGWDKYDIPVGKLSQPVYYLIFANDKDLTPYSATSKYRNVKLYEGP